MRVKDLIAALRKFDENLEVYGMCDHGQSPEKVCSPQFVYTSEHGHNLYDEFTIDAEEAEEVGYSVLAVIL